MRDCACSGFWKVGNGNLATKVCTSPANKFIAPNPRSELRLVRNAHGGGGGRRVEQARVRRRHHLPAAQHRRPEWPGRRRGRDVDIAGGHEWPAVGPAVHVDQPHHRVCLEVAVGSVQHPAVDCAAPPYRQSDERSSGAGRAECAQSRTSPAAKLGETARGSSSSKPSTARRDSLPSSSTVVPSRSGPSWLRSGLHSANAQPSSPEDAQRAGGRTCDV